MSETFRNGHLMNHLKSLKWLGTPSISSCSKGPHFSETHEATLAGCLVFRSTHRGIQFTTGYNWVCLKIVYLIFQWIITMFPIKNAICGYPPFSDKPNWRWDIIG